MFELTSDQRWALRGMVRSRVRLVYAPGRGWAPADAVGSRRKLGMLAPRRVLGRREMLVLEKCGLLARSWNSLSDHDDPRRLTQAGWAAGRELIPAKVREQLPRTAPKEVL